MVYCVHGNKWGIAQCCDDLNYDSLEDEEELLEEDPVHCHTERREGLDKK